MDKKINMMLLRNHVVILATLAVLLNQLTRRNTATEGAMNCIDEAATATKEMIEEIVG